MDKQTAIQELKKLQELKRQKRILSSDIRDCNKQISSFDEECMGLLAERERQITEKLSDAERMPVCADNVGTPAIYNYVGIIPPAEQDFRKLTLIRSGLLAVASVFVFLFFRVLFLALIGQLENPESLGNALSLLAGIPAFGVLGYSLFHLICKPEQKAYEQQFNEHQQALNKFNKMKGNYEAEVCGCIANNENNLQTYEAAYKRAVVNYIHALSDHKVDLEDFKVFKEAVNADCEKKKQPCREQLAKLQAKLDQCIAQLDKVEVLHIAHWDFVDVIVDLLETGRADSCKEALNIAIEQKAQQDHYAAMEDLRRQELEEMKQENMRAEEARKEQLRQEEMARAEALRHNMVMEQQQAEHNRAMQRAEQDRIRAEERARRSAETAARQANSDARARAWEQCRVCAKRSGCRNPGIPGCGAFVPRH